MDFVVSQALVSTMKEIWIFRKFFNAFFSFIQFQMFQCSDRLYRFSHFARSARFFQLFQSAINWFRFVVSEGVPNYKLLVISAWYGTILSFCNVTKLHCRCNFASIRLDFSLNLISMDHCSACRFSFWPGSIFNALETVCANVLSDEFQHK